jgi:hypothetical protein
MMVTPLLLIGATFIAADPQEQLQTARKPNFLAPSLPELTEDEENKLDEVINRFIDYDSGKVRGPEGRQSVADFQKLGPETIPALIRGLNRAAKIEHSCPAVTIAKRLARLLRATKDPALLQFARENVGAGVTQSRHMAVIKDLKMVCMMRARSLADSGETAEPFEGSYTFPQFGSSSSGEREMRSLPRQLASLTESELKEKLADKRPEVRAAAAEVVARKGLHWESELINLLGDTESTVREAAHRALVRLSKGSDFGPKAGADEAERKEAQKKWRDWLAQQNGR